MDNPALWGFAGAVTTAIIGLIGIVIKSRGEQKKIDAEVGKLKSETSGIAVDAAKQAVGTMSQAMDRMEAEVTRLQASQDDMGRRLTLTDERLAAVTTRHDVAIVHIADREAFTVSFHPTRPEALPPVPEILVPEVLMHRPDLPLRRDDISGEPDGEAIDQEP